MTVRELELREDVHVSRVGGSEEGEEVTCVGSSQPHKLGPMDKWTKAIDSTATKSESLSQQKLNKELWKERLHEVHKYIARWVFNHGNFLAVFLFQISISSDFLAVPIALVLNTNFPFL